MPHFRTRVLVVGAGQSGCVLALELARHGVPSVVLERASRPPRRAELTLLRAAVHDHPLIDLREGWTFTGLRLEPDRTVATVIDRGTRARHVFEAEYLAGCDGGPSTVRRCLDVPLEDALPVDVSRILDVPPWDGALGIARHYRRGPAFLVGESAHRFHPPSRSTALCLGDAADLGKKLAAVLTGGGVPGLLDSYEQERRPLAVLEREALVRDIQPRTT
jgi:2-polyprenyl-6-methoxyphenol hydroxylase-like FAD-dependent oxidoreductase